MLRPTRKRFLPIEIEARKKETGFYLLFLWPAAKRKKKKKKIFEGAIGNARCESRGVKGLHVPKSSTNPTLYRWQKKGRTQRDIYIYMRVCVCVSTTRNGSSLRAGAFVIRLEPFLICWHAGISGVGISSGDQQQRAILFFFFQASR